MARKFRFYLDMVLMYVEVGKAAGVHIAVTTMCFISGQLTCKLLNFFLK